MQLPRLMTETQATMKTSQERSKPEGRQRGRSERGRDGEARLAKIRNAGPIRSPNPSSALGTGALGSSYHAGWSAEGTWLGRLAAHRAVNRGYLTRPSTGFARASFRAQRVSKRKPHLGSQPGASAKEPSKPRPRKVAFGRALVAAHAAKQRGEERKPRPKDHFLWTRCSAQQV